MPDRVHLIFELAKKIEDPIALAKGTLAKAGKDDLGKELHYGNDEETSLSKAQVAGLSSIFIHHEDTFEVFAAPIANSLDGLGTPIEDAEPKWHFFGEDQKGIDEARTMQDADVGMAISSNLLLLQEGTRYIILHLKLSESLTLANDALNDALICDLTTAEGWLRKGPLQQVPAGTDLEDDDVFNSVRIKGDLLSIKLKLDPADTAIVPYNEEVHAEKFDTNLPLLKVRCQSGSSAYPLLSLHDSSIESIDLDVEVFDLRNLTLQNDQGVLDPAKPFHPFGSQPSIGSSFYVGSPEVFSKKLSLLTFYGTWVDLPDTSFKTHYKNYGKTLENEDFKVNCMALRDNRWHEDPAAGEYNLFYDAFSLQFAKRLARNTANVATTSGQVAAAAAGLTKQQAAASATRASGQTGRTAATTGTGSTGIKPIEPPPAERWNFTMKDTGALPFGNDKAPADGNYRLDSRSGFLRMQLTSPEKFAFGHKKYVPILTEKVVKQLENELPQPPYTPLLKDLTMYYRATGSIDLTASTAASRETNDGQFFSIHPFGQREEHLAILNEQNEIGLLPRFNHVDDEGSLHQHQGEFFLGLTGARPRQNISLLFQLAEGSANPELAAQTIVWEYLAGNEWKVLESTFVLRDQTNGLLQSGIITFSLPAEIDETHTLMPSGTMWLKASVDRNVRAVSDAITVTAQAAEFIFEDKRNDEKHLLTPLSANSVSKFLVSDARIKSILQPYASFDGKARELDSHYYLRVAERLRHKQRGITIWDYERLVLEAFPDIYKVKCINHSTYNLTKGTETIHSEFAPGYVTIVVIPNQQNKNAIDPFEPRASLATLEKIKHYLQKYMVGQAAERLTVLNPLYEQIQLEFEVVFRQPYDPTIYKSVLDKDIQEFLTPWAFEDGQDITFGGKIHRSVILHFVEHRPYVDYVKLFQMKRYVKGELLDEDIEEAFTTTARSIFVSHKQHTIKEPEAVGQ